MDKKQGSPLVAQTEVLPSDNAPDEGDYEVSGGDALHVGWYSRLTEARKYAEACGGRVWVNVAVSVKVEVRVNVEVPSWTKS